MTEVNRIVDTVRTEFSHELSPELGALIELTQQAGPMAIDLRKQGHFERTAYDSNTGYSTQGDKMVGDFITEKVRGLIPGVKVISEEEVESRQRAGEEIDYTEFKEGKTAIIDPIDGTGWYKDKGKIWSVTMALLESGRNHIALTYWPETDELWFAQAGQGAYYADSEGNVEGIHVKQLVEKEPYKVAIGCNMSPTSARLKLIDIVTVLVPEPRNGMSIVESTALDCGWIAQGVRNSGIIHPQCKLWDKAAGWTLITEAGGIASAWDGSKDLFEPGFIAAANQRVYDELFAATRKIQL